MTVGFRALLADGMLVIFQVHFWSDSMKATFFIFLTTCFAFVLPPRPASSQEVAMFVDPNAAWHVDSELELVDFLESAGYSVTVQPVADIFGEDQAEFAADFDLIYLADSIGSTTVHDGLDIYMKDIEVPILSQEAYMWDEAEWTGRVQFDDFGDTFQALEDNVLGAFTQLEIANPNHPMAAGLSGLVDVYTDPYGFNFGFIPQMGPDVNVIATVPGAPEYAALFVYEKGAALAEGTISAGMRIGMFLGQNVAREEFDGDGTNNRWDRLTEDGMALVKAAFDYATGKTGGLTGDYNANGVIDAGDLDLHGQYVRDGNPAGDVDGDGDTDGDDRRAWVETIQNSWFGDTNFDNEFNSSDFVAVFQAGKFETDVIATYAEGDWDGNTRFGTSDFVVAFQHGGFEIGPRPGAISVPEPSCAALLAIGIVGLCRIRNSRFVQR